MSQNFPAVATSDLGSDIFDRLITRSDTLRSNFSGTSSPGTPVVGQFFVEDAGGVDALYLYCSQTGGADAWRGVALQRLTFDLNFDPDTAEGRGGSLALKQALGMRLENRGTHPSTIAAGNLGFVWVYTGGSDNQPYYSDGTNRCGILNAVDSATSGSFDDVPIDLSSVWLGSTPPTLKQLGDAVGYLFDAVPETMALPVRVPKSWRADGDILLRLLCWLDGAETANDKIEWTGTIRAVTPATDAAGTADAIDKATSALIMQDTDIGTNTAAGSLFECDLILDFDDASNPIAITDLLVVTINRATVGGAGKVGGVVLASAVLLYRQKPRHAKA